MNNFVDILQFYSCADIGDNELYCDSRQLQDLHLSIFTTAFMSGSDADTSLDKPLLKAVLT